MSLNSQDLVEEMPLNLSNEFWEALQTRDPRYYTRFVYGVNSTKIYCRPTCPSKKPSRFEAVSFFRNPAMAKESGYRACERCKPDDENAVSDQVQSIQKLCEFIIDNWQEKLTLETLGKQAGLSPFHLQRTFKKVTGVSPREYIEALRLSKMKLSLKSGNSIRKSTYRSGYNTTGWLYFRPNEKLGMSPSKYKQGAEGIEIDYVIRDSPLGKLLVAATDKGVCLVNLADSDEKLVAHLRSEFPKATLQSGSTNQENKYLAFSVEKILDYLTNGTDLERSNLPLDLYATAFQQRVWKELRAIPYGKVRSYSEVAKRIGSPKATRAVANACASNPVPLVIPCHRVVPKGGGVGQYGLGIGRKKILLELEGLDLKELKGS
jgi:AraC family transcriptional regulator, regulatory protein of adaptative response / methylated-DNA-[protein]-cysteine methyltransferase